MPCVTVQTCGRFTPTPVGNTHCHDGYSFFASGSPPRLWGIPRSHPARAPSSRFTPTPVGNTRRYLPLAFAPAVHPHACGEYGRGKPSVGIGPVHPHACGEYGAAERLVSAGVGSPPRLWGIPAKVNATAPLSRFTPTPVGNTQRRRPTARYPAVHPHACGEYPACAMFWMYPNGSPPRLWGIRQFLAIPCRLPGSPPRLWGIPRPHGFPLAANRFTPTPVGNTLPP